MTDLNESLELIGIVKEFVFYVLLIVIGRNFILKRKVQRRFKNDNKSDSK